MIGCEYFLHDTFTLPAITQRLVDHTSFPSMEVALEEVEAYKAEWGHWLNCETRCFGDKGDVEDITEGKS